MTEFVSIYADGDSGKVVTVSAAFAEGIGAKALKDVPPLDSRGRPFPPRDLSKRAAKSATVEEILTEVGDDSEKAAAALAEEQAGKNRKTLVASLEAIITPTSGDSAGDN